MNRLLIFVFSLSLAPVAWAGQELTYIDLTERMIDMEYLALLPEPGENYGLISCYDRASKYNAETGEYIDWDANNDNCGEMEKSPDPLGVLLGEMQGPGCIWRIWSADPQQQHVRIYLDGSETPAIDLSFYDYFSRECFPFSFPSMAYISAKGRNLYMPIPYQKSCKIYAEEGFCNFFHFDYTTFPKDTKVPTFKRQLTVEDASALGRLDKKFSQRGIDPKGKHPRQTVHQKKVQIPIGKTVSVLELTGEGAITAIRAKIDLPDPAQARRILRELTLSIKWDGEEKPSVWAPFGDFFGTAPGANAYRSLPLGLTKDGWWYSYWYMPFAKGAKVEVANDGRENQEIEFEIVSGPLSQPVEKLGRFHAKWHRDAFLPEDPNRQIDWTILKTTGRGRFCGFMLHVWNPIAGWWGEGDNKFFVDGEKFPSVFGTGSEDYFGYAWGDSIFYDRPFHNQTLCEGVDTGQFVRDRWSGDDMWSEFETTGRIGTNKGHISVNRWQIADNVPFRTSFEGYMEKYFGNDRPTYYAVVAYWYLAPGGIDPYEPVTDVWDRLGYVVTDLVPPTTPQSLFVQGGNLILETKSKSAEIRYTSDGSDPTMESPLYDGPIPVSKPMIVKARTFKEGRYPSMTKTIPVKIVPSYLEAEHPQFTEKGLRYCYFEGTEDESKMSDYISKAASKTGAVDVIDLGPAKALDQDMDCFALIFDGFISVPKDDVYEFIVKGDCCEFYLGDQLVLRSDMDVPGGVEESELVALRAGLHPITIFFFEREDEESLDVWYRSSKISKQPIPADVLFRKP